MEQSSKEALARAQEAPKRFVLKVEDVEFDKAACASCGLLAALPPQQLGVAQTCLLMRHLLASLGALRNLSLLQIPDVREERRPAAMPAPLVARWVPCRHKAQLKCYICTATAAGLSCPQADCATSAAVAAG
eukprot:1160793-Pelagomonas_calceolata.AAC.5